MGDFKRNSFGGGDRKSFGDKKSFGGGDRKSFGGRGGAGGGRPSFGGGRPDREMFTTECEKCRKSCQVPFKPSGDKPVYCNDCFSPPERSSFGNDRGGRDSGRPSFGNDRGARSFEPRRPAAVVNTTESVTFQFEALKKQMATLSEKIDAIAYALNVNTPVKKEATRGLKEVLKGIKDQAGDAFSDVSEVIEEGIEKVSKTIKDKVDTKTKKAPKKKTPVKKEKKEKAAPKKAPKTKKDTKSKTKKAPKKK